MDASISFSHLFTQEVTTSQLITPPSKARYALITGCGGGGGGGAGGTVSTTGYGGAGGNGAPVITEFLKIEPGQSLDCVIGVGGNGGTGNQGSGGNGSPSIVTHGSKTIRFPGGTRGYGGGYENRSTVLSLDPKITGSDAALLISDGLPCTAGGGSILSRYSPTDGQNSRYASGGIRGAYGPALSGPGGGGGASLGNGGNGGNAVSNSAGIGSPGMFGGGGGGGATYASGLIQYHSGGKGGDGKLIIEWFM
jgi:hypothetical protein